MAGRRVTPVVPVRPLGLGVVIALILTALAACTGGAEPRAIPSPGQPQPTPTPRPVSLPADEGTHDDRLEWWYYNGHLVSEDGRQFGYHMAVFQRYADEQGRQYSGQFTITHVDENAHVQASMQSASPSLGDGGQLDLEASGWTVRIDDETHEITASDAAGNSLELVMQPVSPAMLHNEIGWLGFFGWTYYYSWPRMVTQGTLAIDGEEYSVTGESWFDHQWGDFFVVGAPAGWQWFAILLDDGSALKLTFARNTDGEPSIVYGTLQRPDGDTVHLEADQLSLRSFDQWTSAETGATYPSGWSVSIAGEDIQLTITPDVLDQEVTQGVPPGATYWEGKSSVEGTIDGEEISGRAYVELTGYVEPAPIPWRD